MSIKKFTILGERCSGTNFLESVILEHFKTISVTWEYGWKHWFDYNSPYLGSEDTLFIGIIRDPIQWLNSLYKTPHHIPNTLNTPEKFLKNEFYSTHNHSQEENLLDRDPNGLRFKNIIGMRNCKLKYLSKVMPKKVKNYLLIRYEDLMFNYKEVLELISKKLDMDLEEIKNLTSPNVGTERFFKSKQVFNIVDLNLERSLGYFNKDFKISNDYRIKYYLGGLNYQEIPEKEIKKNITADSYTLITEKTTINENHRLKGYFKDFKEIFCVFDTYKVVCMFGDVMTHDKFNSFSKCRLIKSPNKKVILKLNKNRHWMDFDNVDKDDIPFKNKENKIIWRGTLKTGNRSLALAKFISENINPRFDFKDVNPSNKTFKLSIKDQLKYKFFLSVEGNDVASNLKWTMYSNSCVLMPMPTCVTWFMEDHLRPYVHYVPILPDFSDLEEQYNWCLENLDLCERIAQNGKVYVSKFLDLKNEEIIEKKLIEEYFNYTKFT